MLLSFWGYAWWFIVGLDSVLVEVLPALCFSCLPIWRVAIGGTSFQYKILIDIYEIIIYTMKDVPPMARPPAPGDFFMLSDAIS